MIASSALFLVAVSVVACAGAYLMEEGLRRMGMPGRLTWLGALALGPALLASRAVGLLDFGAGAEPPAWAPMVELPAMTFAPPQSGPGIGLEEGVGVLWALSAVALLALVWKTHRMLLRERSGWESTQVLGRDVFVSADRGPAVAGMWDPWIVLPRWVLALPDNELRMVLLHEEEHLRARDTYLLGGALALVALTAWNPVTWWQLRRLRAAMEVDCDRRVLQAAPHRATYGASLLTVAARAAGPSLGLAAFTERSLNLKRRILAMTARTSRWTAAGGGVMVVLGLVVGVQACGVESPVGIQVPNGPRAAEAPTVAVPEPDLAAGPRPTPFTNPPVLQNRDELMAMMEKEYPPLLRDAGIVGEARLYFLIGKDGTVLRFLLDQSSGHPALDAAALRVAEHYEFAPAKLRDDPVPVWVSFPVTFTLGEGENRSPMVLNEDAPPAPEAEGLRPDPQAEPAFTPFTVAPSITNRDEVVAAMEREYPAELRDLAIGGTVRVYFFINEEGVVERTLIDRSSGQDALDEAAMKVASVYRFTPALNKSKKVPVWVSFPITFQVR